eukprot:47848_1
MSLSFLSYSSPVDHIYDRETDCNYDLSKAILMREERSSESFTTNSNSNSNSNNSEICIEQSQSPLSTFATQSNMMNNNQEVCIEFPLRDFEDFYLHNVPSPEFHPGSHVFDFAEALSSDTTHSAPLSDVIELCLDIKPATKPFYATPRISIATPKGIASHQSAKIARFASMSIGRILNLRLGMMELVELNVIERLMADQYGSRYLQNLIRSFESDFCLEMITVLLHHLVDTKADLIGMSEDMYGNYLIQLFFVRGNAVHHEMLLKHIIYPAVLRLCESKFGCRVVQKALESIGNADRLIECFKEQTSSNSSLHDCLLCCNGNHVIQKMIQLKPSFQVVAFIKDALEKDLVGYSENVYACRVVQAFVVAYGDKLNVHKLLEKDAHLFLSRVKYGNYVIQCIVQKGVWYSDLKLIRRFRNQLIGDVFADQNVLFLSKDKHASNVIETCVKVASERQLQGLVHTMCSKQGFVLRNMISDRFGNYVPRTLLRHCNRKQQRKVVNTVHVYITNLYDYEHGYQSAEFIQMCRELKCVMK